MPTPCFFSSRTMSCTRSNVTTCFTCGSSSGVWFGLGLGTGFHAWRMRISGASTPYLRSGLSFTRSVNGTIALRSSWYFR